ncbi:MAG: hypothetical protein KBC66_07640 [Kiritimatiellae bacterium]|nr:hypothetical protein [Kiritimatiellia bacterium]
MIIPVTIRPGVHGVGRGLLLAGLGLFAGGCAAFAPPRPEATLLYTDAASLEELFEASPAPAGPTGPLDLINAALANDPAIRNRLHDLRRMDLQAGRARILRSPEIRAGGSQTDAEGSDHRTESGTRSTSSRETRTGATQDILPINQPRSREQEIRESSSWRQTTGERYSWENYSDDGWSVGVRLYPPNPWSYAAQVSLADARFHAAAARLGQEQLDITEETAVLAARLLQVRKEIQLLLRLDAVARKELGQVANRPVTDQADALRRTLGIQTRLARAEHVRADLLSELARLTGHEIDPNALEPEWDWLPVGEITREAIEPLVHEVHARRPDIACAYWQACELIAEHHAARAENIPWIQSVDLAYDRDRRNRSAGYDASSRARETAGGQSRTQTAYADGTLRSSRESSHEQARLREQESGRETGSQHAEEWSLQAAIEIPVFQWLSRQSSRARGLAEAARADLQNSRRSARHDLRTRLRLLRKTRDDLERFKETLHPAVTELARQLNLLRRNRLLRPDETIQILEQITDVAIETSALEHAYLEARIGFWIACGAPLPE